MGFFSADDGTDTVVLELNTELWLNVAGPGRDPEAELLSRVLDQLREEGYQEDEIQSLCSDPLLMESIREQFWTTRAYFERKRRLPRSIEVEFTRPGTQGPNGPVDEGGQ